MKVRSVYRQDVTYASPGDTLRDAARKMRSSGQGCLPVVDGAAVMGIVTERDLTEAMANGVGPSTGRVADYTNDGCVTISLNEDCDVAALKMLAIGCRNLPVVDGARLVGMVSMRDVILRAADYEARRARVPAGGWPEEPPPDVDSER